MLEARTTYDALVRDFRWRIPDLFNIGVDITDRWAAIAPDQVAVIEAQAGAAVVPVTYGELSTRSNRIARALLRRGIRRGDRVAILLPQSALVPAVHAAVYKIGAVAVPLAALFGVDALTYRLRDAGAAGLVTDAAGLSKLAAGGDAGQLPAVTLCADGAGGGADGLLEAMEAEDDAFTPVITRADDPALMIYTSGTTGPAKGALHAHRVLLGHLPGVQMPHEFLPQPGDRQWTPADWAWAGGLLNVLLPSLHFGVPVLARAAAKFDPEEAFRLMAEHGVRNTFVPPTALRMLRGVARPRERFDLALRSIGSGGESLGAETLAWGREALGLSINEFYGQTECNLVLASCAGIGVSRPGFIGRPVPGHTVAVVRPDATPCEPGEEGQIAVMRPDPVMFLGYWNRPEATEAKFTGDWLMTGDQALRDADGYIRFVGRDDDVITSSGYRIGPGEIEDCLLKHEAVQIAAVVGKPDPVRTEIVKAFVVLRPGHVGTSALVAELQRFVRERLAAHEYPREIVFRDSLPLTTTGKIIRRELRDEG